jgi:hypothetical protein
VTDDDKPDWSKWDPRKAAGLVGSLVLVGITYTRPDGEVRATVEAYGVVVSANEINGISIEAHGETWNGQTFAMPPSPNAFFRASPGEYRLKTTGEVVVDPDYTTTWTIADEPNS